MSQLITYDISGNPFTGNFSEYALKLQQLEVLYMIGIGLSHISDLSNLTNITMLKIDLVGMDIPPDVFDPLTDLEVLTFSDAKLSAIPA